MGFTPNQQNAIDVRDRTLLVSAAAGSGKTFTLTQRIIRSIVDDGQDLSRLLIVTFTKAAASELKAKIARAVSEAIEQNPNDPRLEEQLIKLAGAHISTIDSFFTEPVRANFEKLGLPASIRLADEAELLPLKERIMQDVLNELFDKCEGYLKGGLSEVGYSDKYTELVGIIAETRSTARLVPTLCDIYSKLLTSPEGIEQLKKHADRLRDGAAVDFFETDEGKILKEKLIENVKYGADTMSLWCNKLSDSGLAPDNMIELFDRNASTLTAIEQKIKGSGYEDAKRAVFSCNMGKLQLDKEVDYDDIVEDAKKARKSVSDIISDIKKKYLYQTAEEISGSLIKYSEMSFVIYDIIKTFDERYRREKLSRGVCEFSDMPIFMLKLLLDENGQPTEYAEQLSQSFDAVYIDEYQDVNEIQDRIFSIIGGDRRFMVGDIKQSIYGFREAEPSIFAQYRRDFATYDKQSLAPDKQGGNTIFMSDNFRCDENVIDFTNLVCSGIFSAFAESIGYTSDDDLKFAKGRPYEEYESPKTVISIVHTPKVTKNMDTDDSQEIADEVREDEKAKTSAALADEAIVVANQIAELIRKHKNADGSRVKAGDIAILVRSMVTVRPLLVALSKLNIKYSLSSKTELFETAEMRMLTALLECVDNPRYDLPTSHLLCAKTDTFEPMFTFEDVIRIRRHTGDSASLYDAVIAYSEQGKIARLRERCRDFVSLIEKMREASGKLSAEKFIKSLSFSPMFSSICQSSAYTFLYDCACKYVKNNWNSLHSFVVYFKDLMENGSVSGEPDKSKKDAVTVMTIHQSKGLEFNVCFLFGFGKQFNTGNKFPILFNKDFGVTMKLPPKREEDCGVLDKIKTRFAETPMWKIICDSVKAKQIEEEARVFYVALTRARERLYISATVSKDYDEYLKSILDCPSPEFEIKKGSSFIHWILLAIAFGGCEKKPYEIELFTKGFNDLTYPFPKETMVEKDDNVYPEEEELATLYNLPMQMTPDEHLLATIPSKIAASKARPNMLDTSIFIPVPTGKLFSDSDEDVMEQSSDDSKQIKARIELMRSQKTDFDSLLMAGEKPTAAEKGTAMHQFLQFCDYQSVDSIGVSGEIERLREERFISHRTASILDAKRLGAFFDGELYEKIRSARKVHREFHFRMFRPASDFTEREDMARLVSDKLIFVQGSIDLVIVSDNGELILCDYKTDRISPEEKSDYSLLIKNMKEKHGEQLSQYKLAIEQIFGRSPDKIYLFLLSIGKCIEI